MKVRTILATIALGAFGTGCLDDAAWMIASEQTDSEWTPPPGDLRMPSTRFLYPHAKPGEMCSSVVSATTYIPCEEVLNPCSLTDSWRTTMFVPERFYCVAVDEFGLATPRVEDICALPHPDFYGCGRTGP